MPDKKIKILSTRPLAASLITKAAANNIAIDFISFIKTEPVGDILIKKQITDAFHQSSTVVFTSMNAAEAVAEQVDELQPAWDIYCLGTATKKIVLERFPLSRVSGEAENASALADEMIKGDVHNVIFFCGDQRRDELPDKLAGHNIPVEEIVVYKTLATPVEIADFYNAILFFSPSAVDSFFSVNTVPGDTILFSIGSTTSDCIKHYSDNKVVQSDHPGKENLVEKTINHFSKPNHTNEHIKK